MEAYDNKTITPEKMAKNKRETVERTETAEAVETHAKREENARVARPCVCGNPNKPEFCTNCN